MYCSIASRSVIETLQIEAGDLAEGGEIDLGVDRGGRGITVPEKVSDHFHGHALVEKMLGGCMAQGMCAPAAGDDAYSREPITTILPRVFRQRGRMGACM